MSGVAAREASWFGQPRGLTVLFLTEMWEKFSFYGMRTLLVYYMTKQLLIGQAQASWIYGVYTASVYLTPIAGGMIADRWLGRRKAVVIGGAVMALGHFILAFDGAFFVALAAIALGNGLFLPSLPSQIEGLYGKGDERRKGAYNVYYMGVNLGAFLAPLVCGALGEIYGWHWGFGAAGVGMAAGLAVYVLGGRYLPPEPPRAKAARVANDPATVRARFAVLLAVMAAVVVFRIAYEQLGNTLALWADAGVDRAVGAWTIPMTWFQSLNPLLVFLLTPFLVAAWARADAARPGRSSAARMAFGAAVVATGFLMLAAIAWFSERQGAPAHWLWFVAFFVILTAGELHILPVGLGLFGRLAPAGLGATAIAVWFFAGFAGNLMAGGLGSLWSRMPPSAFFALAGCVALVAAAALKAMQGAVGRAEQDAEAKRAAEAEAA